MSLCLVPIVAIAGYLIYETIADVGLTVFNARTVYLEYHFFIMSSYGHAAAHLARITAHAWRGKLDACRQMPAFRMNGVCQR